MRRALVLQYLGTHFAGWQAQENAVAIQNLVERAVQETLSWPERIPIRGASRTDSGVHALMQVAHLDLPFEVPLSGLAKGINNHLPPAIRVLRAVEVPEEFDALDDARGKEYRYRLWCDETVPPLLAAAVARGPERLDLERMRRAAERMPGRRDLRLFAKTGSDTKTTIRDLTTVEIETDGELIVFRFGGSGFLRGSVRLLAGTLVEVGRGRLPEEAPERLLAGDESVGRVGPSLPASGLILWRIDYDLPGLEAVMPPPTLW